MMRGASSFSAGGVAAGQIVERMKQRQTAFRVPIPGELEMNSGKRAKHGLPRTFFANHFGGSGSIRFSILTVSRIVLPTISRLLGLSFSTVSCGVCQKTLL